MDQCGPDDPEPAGLRDPVARRARRGGSDGFDSFGNWRGPHRFDRFSNRHGPDRFDGFSNRHGPDRFDGFSNRHGHGDGWAWDAPGLASRNQETAHNHEFTVHGAPGKSL